MPDAFGFLTPEETRAQIVQRQRRRFQLAQQSGSSGRQVGASLAAIFGPMIKTTIDTRKARQAETLRLMKTQGLSEDEAKKQARASIGRHRKEIRQAQQIQEATSEMQSFMDSLPDETPMDMRMAQGKLMLANRMRNMGLISQANNLSLQASQEIQAAEDAALERENLKARTRASAASAAISEAELPFVGATGFMENVIQKEQIIAKLNDPNSQLDQSQRSALMRAKGHLEAKILKDETIVGRTKEDLRGDPTLTRKLFSELSDNQVLVNNIDESIAQLQDLDSFDKTFWANLGKDGLGFLERWFGREPTETEQDFMQRVQSKQGKAALIAAKVRHALTGAQMSAFEIGFLAPFLPDPNDDVSTQINKMRIVREYTQLDSDTRMQMFQQGLTEKWLENAGNGISENPVTGDLPDGATVTDVDNALEARIAELEEQT